MSIGYKLLKSILADICYDKKDFLHQTDVENVLNTAPAVWKGIFKDNNWLELATTYDRCVPVLICSALNTFRSRKSSNDLYFCLLARDYSSDLRFRRDELFESLQEGWKYDRDKYEISFPSGITVNVHEVITGQESAVLPLKRLFSGRKNRIQSEYLVYGDTGFKVLEAPNIIGLKGATQRWKDVKNGCAFRISYQWKG